MAKRKSKLPQQWHGHTFSRSDIEAALAWLSNQQATKGAPFMGERLALALLEKTPRELENALGKLDNEAGNEMTDCMPRPTSDRSRCWAARADSRSLSPRWRIH
jgi:hypothetical protein